MSKDKIFEKNPHLKEYFKTSDGKSFYSENGATNHAKTLEDKTVTPVKRGDYTSAEKSNDKTKELSALEIEMKRIGKMKKADLIIYAKETYALDLDAEKNVPELVELVKEAVEASLKSKND